MTEQDQMINASTAAVSDFSEPIRVRGRAPLSSAEFAEVRQAICDYRPWRASGTTELCGVQILVTLGLREGSDACTQSKAK